MFSKFREKSQHIAVAASLALITENAFAAGGGSNKAIEFLKAVIKWLGDMSPYVITVCILVVGYVTLVRGNTIQESSKIIIGACIIGSASFIAGLLT